MTITYTYTGVTPFIKSNLGYEDFVTALQFNMTAEENGITVSMSNYYEYDDNQVYTEDDPYLSFDEWKDKKMIVLMDAISLTYKWKTQMQAAINKQQITVTAKPIDAPSDPVEDPPVNNPDPEANPESE